MAGLQETIKPATSMFKGGLSNISWVFWLVIALGVILAIIFIVSKVKRKKNQWTHTLKVRRVLQNGILSDPIVHRMRRFPLIKGAEVFELEKPLLGTYLFPELDSYSGINEYSIILDNNNRIYTNKGEFFKPDKRSVEVSAIHSEIDIQLSNLKTKFQNINKVKKRLEWEDIAKYAFLGLLIIAIMIVSIVGISNWSDAQEQKAEAEKANAEAMSQLADVMEANEAVINLLNLMLPELKELKGTNNIQSLINEEADDEDTN